MRTISTSSLIVNCARLHVGARVEHAAFFLGQPVGRDEIRLVDVRALHPDDYDRQSGDHIGLADSVRPELIGWAWERDLSLVEAHTHIAGDPVCLSPTDIAGLAEWVPHVRWRLRAQPYAALVFGDRTVDGLVWRDHNEEPEGIAALQIDGSPPHVMTGLSLRALRGRMTRDG